MGSGQICPGRPSKMRVVADRNGNHHRFTSQELNSSVFLYFMETLNNLNYHHAKMVENGGKWWYIDTEQKQYI